MHTLQPDQIRSIHHAELATSYAEPGRQPEIVNESLDLHLNTLKMVIDSTKKTGPRPHTAARSLSVVTNINKIFLINNGFFGNPTLRSGPYIKFSIFKMTARYPDRSPSDLVSACILYVTTRLKKAASTELLWLSRLWVMFEAMSCPNIYRKSSLACWLY